ncbi:MAG: type V CRISPR-associated protein Cas4 [Candidatus Nanoarchaeia archaeon]
MEENIIISNLNDFIFCPRSIYFHNLYYQFDEKVFHSTYQQKGKDAHKNVDTQTYSSKKNILQGIDIYSEELGVIGKIDLLDLDNKELIERKNVIKTIYEGYYLQIWSQYFCLIEMGYEVEKLSFYSMKNNSKISIDLPTDENKRRLKEVISQMRSFDLFDTLFSQNPKKCEMCIYKELCDYYKK